MDIVIGHKGKQYVRVHVKGKETHSSLSPTGVNAIEYAARIISYIREVDERFAIEGPFDYDFDTPRTTLMTGVIHGGTSLNIVPNYCWFDFEIRELAECDPEAILGEIRDFAENVLLPKMRVGDSASDIVLEIKSARPVLDTKPNEEVVSFFSAIAGRNSTHKTAFGSEAALFQQHADIPTVVCGPGNINEAHKPDEFIEVGQVQACEAFIRRLRDRMCEA